MHIFVHAQLFCDLWMDNFLIIIILNKDIYCKNISLHVFYLSFAVQHNLFASQKLLLFSLKPGGPKLKFFQ